MVAKLIIVILLFSGTANADERKVADVISYGTVITQITLDTIHSIKSEDKKRDFSRQGLKLALTISESELIKKLIHVRRPDGSDDKSFWSEHSAIASTSGKGMIGVSLTVSTMSGRVIAKKHRVIDVLTGAGIGLLNSILVDKVIR